MKSAPTLVCASCLLALAACQGAGRDTPLPEERSGEPPTIDLSVAAAPARRPLPDAVAAALTAAWREFRASDTVEELGIAVAGPAGSWSSPSPQGRPRFYWASVGKLVTSLLVQQLFTEGRLYPEQPLAHWYPQLPGADRITLQMLLTHRSGLPSHNELAQFRNRGQPGTPEDVARFLEATPLLFPPGEGWHYSNSAYLLLGRIIETELG